VVIFVTNRSLRSYKLPEPVGELTFFCFPFYQFFADFLLDIVVFLLPLFNRNLLVWIRNNWKSKIRFSSGTVSISATSGGALTCWTCPKTPKNIQILNYHDFSFSSEVGNDKKTTKKIDKKCCFFTFFLERMASHLSRYAWQIR